MSKLILTGFCAAAALGLAACGPKAEENNVAVENLDEVNTAEDMNMDMGNMDMNMEMNATENAADATGNAAVDNTAGNAY